MNDVILVCGFGRCGSSLIMQMIKAAGVPLYGNPDPPVYEVPQASELPAHHVWLFHAQGMAVKVLSPQIYRMPPNLMPMRAIWLERNLREQAKSLCKLRKYPPTRANRKRFERKLARDRKSALRVLNAACREPPIMLHFEEILSNPLAAAAVLAAWLGTGEIGKIAGVVMPRSPECAPGWNLEVLNMSLSKGV